MPDDDKIKKPEILPILPLFEVILFPKMVLPLVVIQKESILLIDEAMSKDRIIGLISSKKADTEEGFEEKDLYTFGTSATILKMAKIDENRAQLLVQGMHRFKIKEFIEKKPYLLARTTYLSSNKTNNTKDIETKALMQNLSNLYNKIIDLTPGLPHEIGAMAQTIDDPGTMADMVISTISSSIEDKQKILEAVNPKKRLKEVTKLVNRQLDILKLGNKIQSQVKGKMDKKQKEFYLRQQLKAIKDELGETDDISIEIDEYKAKIEKKELPELVAKEAKKELNRLSKMHPSSSEYTVASTYIDWITTLPWNNSTKDNLDIKKAKKILNNDHYGLDKAKKRIIEYLAVKKLKPDSKGPILCFVGPPGTGKTSLGNSIANALGRKFIRIALGGVRDEAEIRGHRRTYVGALPGRIIQGIRRAESNNPVFMLDEIDKIGSDFRGDPSSALLEVLDPEQNFSFSDNYLDVPFDLSKVMFITTANILDTIPPALRDRMETLRLSGYTEEEKIKISNKYLIPRQRKAHGLDSSNISFTKGAIKQIISGYTREAGLRNLEREIASICRGVAAKVAEEEIKYASITMINIQKYLGPEKINPEKKARMTTTGVAMGLAWTPYGGEILFIEAASMPGNKGLILTGQLGDVMKESATAALTYIRSHAKALTLKEDDYFLKHELHIHVPEGAIPKDGPSAGVTIFSALVSLLTNKPINKDLAMTGEITLRGQVLPVGGIKEKVLAAHRAGIKTIILPKWNEKDLVEIPKKIKKVIKFYFAEKIDDILQLVFQK